MLLEYAVCEWTDLSGMVIELSTVFVFYVMTTVEQSLHRWDDRNILHDTGAVCLWTDVPGMKYRTSRDFFIFFIFRQTVV